MKTAIQFDRVSKKFKLNSKAPRSFMEVVVQRKPRDPSRDVWVLKDVSLTIHEGEMVGLIGPNGTGKSTILKLINRIIEPSAGLVKANGRIASLLELGAGFHPDLSGRENIYLNAAVLGIPRRVVKNQLDAIIDFAEIGSFIDVPVRNYSSGMAMRLGFAITTTLDPDILLIDEILAVGDYAFQRKCFDRLEILRTRGVTILLVSHSLDQIQRLCARAIWLSQGEVRADGETESVIGLYLDSAGPDQERRFLPQVSVVDELHRRWGTYQAEITSVELLDSNDQPAQVFLRGDRLRVRMHYHTQAAVEEPTFGLALYRSDGLHINGPNSVADGLRIPCIDGIGYVDYTIDTLPLATGRYELTVAIYNRDSTRAYDHQHRLYRFEVQDRRFIREEGVVHLPAQWHWVRDDSRLRGSPCADGLS